MTGHDPPDGSTPDVEPGRPAAGPSGALRGHLTAPDALIRTCPICGKTLAERRCKLYCPDPICGYFLSCADYY